MLGSPEWLETLFKHTNQTGMFGSDREDREFRSVVTGTSGVGVGHGQDR